MANEVHAAPPEEASMTSLLRGIINDLGDLIRQEIRFARTEIRSDVRKTTRSAAVLALGVGAAGVGVVLVALMMVFMINELSNNYVPLWGSFGIVAAVFLVIGAGLCFMGYQTLQKNNPLPDQTAQSVKENVEWIMNSK